MFFMSYLLLKNVTTTTTQSSKANIPLEMNLNNERTPFG